MPRFEACDCQTLGCYRCAVGFVIASLGFSPDCPCFSSLEKPCRNRCQRMYPDWTSAFERCVAPYAEWAKRRAAKLGVVVKHREIYSYKDTLDGDKNDPETAAEQSQGVFLYLVQDPERAAAEIAPASYIDPISFDAASLIVLQQIMSTGIVPIALRNWVADVITGATKRPTFKGKVPGATAARDKMIYALIRDLVEHLGLRPTSSNRENGQSACHAVAEAFALLGQEGTILNFVR